MGLKIRRLKSGFAYYAEYKLGGQCVYEKIQAGSAREAKRIYAARTKELRSSIAAGDKPKLRSARNIVDERISTALSAMLRKLIAKHVISEADAIELLPEFSSLRPPEPDAAPVAAPPAVPAIEPELAGSKN